jgi:predicted PurR-regulated permease PerM
MRDDVRELGETLPAAFERARDWVSSQIGVESEIVQRAAEGSVASPRGPGGPDSQAPMAGSLIQMGLAGAVSFAGQFVVIFFLTFFLLLSGRRVTNRLVEIAGPDAERRRVTSTIMNDINTQIQRYLLVLLVTAVMVGAATWVALAWMGVRNAATWGVLAGVFNSIPYFGPVIVSGGLFAVGVVQGGGITQALQMSGAAILITSLEGWLLTPALMGKAERMSALAVFIGLLLWTWIWGGWGTVLAVPMLVVIKSLGDHVQSLRPLGRLMAPL